MAVFCLFLKSLPEAKLKSFGTILLAEETLKQPSIDYVMWLLMVTLMKIYKAKGKAEQAKLQKVNFE